MKKGLTLFKNKYGISILFSLPFLTIFFIFKVLPVLIAVILSFTQYDILQSPKFLGIDNYLMIFLDDAVFTTALKNTILFALIFIPISMLGCLMIAWIINDFSPAVRIVFTFLFYAPSISGSVMAIWAIIFSGDSYGLINSISMSLGLISSPIQWLTNPKYIFTVLVIVSIWGSLDLGFLSYVAAFRGIDPALYEAASIDGVKNRTQELWYITLPTLRPQMLFSAINSITAAFGVGTVSLKLFGNPSTDYAGHTILLHMQDYANTRYDLGVACAIAVVLFALMVFSNYLLKTFIKKLGR